MIIGIFILVIMGLLAATILRIRITDTQASATEMLSFRTFYVGESALQHAMNLLFLDDQDCSDVTTDTTPPADGITYNLPIPPFQDELMEQCEVETLICYEYKLTLSTHYQVETTARCGVIDDPYMTRRTLRVQAKKSVTP